ncbi:MAG: TldD/PmbA family protein [Pyrobaculum sp.]
MILKILEGKVDEAAVVKTRVDNYMARFANNEITVFKNWTVENTYLYVARGRRVASAGFTGRPALEEVERLVKSLESLPEDPLYVSLGGPAPVSHSEAGEDFSKLPDLVKRAVDAAEGVERNAGVVAYTYVSVEYEDTAGRSGRYAVNRVYMTMRSFSGEFSVTGAAAARRISELKAEELGSRNAQLLSLSRGLPQIRIEPTRADLLLSPLVFGHILGEVAALWTNGAEVLSGSSRYSKEDLGAAVASPALTVVEKAADPASYGFTPFDVEGVPAKAVELYKRGVLSGFIHTRRTANALGAEPTGHDLFHWVRPYPGHLEIAGGDAPDDLQDLFKELGSGFYIHNNWYTRYQNVKTGQFSTVGRDLALEIKNGRPTAVVKFIRVADTLENLVKNVSALSKTTRQVYWWDMPVPATAPYALVRNVGVTT